MDTEKSRLVQLFLALVFLCTLETAFSLRCYHCDEKGVGLEWCMKAEEKECRDSQSICLKYVYTPGKKGSINRIQLKCVPRSDYSSNQINTCDKPNKPQISCTCDTDLCNDKELGTGSSESSEEYGTDGNGTRDRYANHLFNFIAIWITIRLLILSGIF